MRSFVSDTVAAFEVFAVPSRGCRLAAKPRACLLAPLPLLSAVRPRHVPQAVGAKLYNSAIMLLPLNTLPMRASQQFLATAKLGMCHQAALPALRTQRSLL